jgi:hypothetical protein
MFKESRRSQRGLVVLGATLAALVGYGLARLAGAHPEAEFDGATQQVGPAAVALASLVAGLAAWGLLALLESRGRRARRTWSLIAVAVLVLSLTGPLTQSSGAGSAATLTALHLIVGVVLIAGLRRPVRPVRPVR